MEDWITSAVSLEQQAPLKRTTKNACILAGAGSGKTRTLVHLLAADLAAGIPASGIIAFTFTEKAAEELLARIHILCRTYLPHIDLEGIYIGTIHAWCLRYLYEQSEFYNVTPIDELQLDALVSRFYDFLGIEKHYSKPYPKGIEKFLADVEIFYNESLSFSQIASSICPCIETFLQILQDNRLLTFGGMIRSATGNLMKSGPVSNLRVLYVDEYQDVNPAQVSLIKSMLPEDARIVVVGDDLQCIYQWRGSDVTRILKVSDDFHDVSVHRLASNYRARPQIVQLGNYVAKNVEFRDPHKQMVPKKRDIAFPIVHWLSFDSEEAQAKGVVKVVQRLYSSGVPYDKISVLLRSVLGSGKPIVDALTGANVPVQCPILSRGGAFIQEFTIPVFNWLRMDHKEPKNEIEELEAEKAADTLWQTVQPWVCVSNAEMTFWENLNKWLDLIEAQHNEGYNVRGQFYDFLDACGCYPAPNDSNMLVGLGIASQIIRSVEEIHRRRFKGHPRKTPRGLMSEVYFSLIRSQENFGESLPIDTKSDAVLIITVHQAKGLEWPVVIIPMLADRRFPVRSRRHGTNFPNEIAERYGTSLEDERRLFYVAVTRAKERLFLLDHNKKDQKKRSIFLKELQLQNAIAPCSPKEVPSQVWKVPKENLQESDPSPLRIGLSDLLIYLECPYQYALRRVVGIQPSIGDELGFGRGLHELIRRRFDAKQKWTHKELKRQVEENVSLPYMSEQDENISKKTIMNRIKGIEQLGVFQSKIEPEVNVEVILEDGIIYGIIDGIQTDSNGSIYVRDWKSNIHENFMPRYNRQLQFYVYALNLQGKNVLKADIVDVGASDGEARLVAKEVDISDATINNSVNLTKEALRGIIQGIFTATPSDISCSCCDMYQICSERKRDGAGK